MATNDRDDLTTNTARPSDADRLNDIARVNANARTDDVRGDDDGLDRNPDPITGAPGSHPAGTAIGSGSGAAVGAAIGAIGGPVGALIGGVAGAVTGAVAGHKAGEANDPTESTDHPAGTKHTDPVAAVTNPRSTDRTV